MARIEKFEDIEAWQRARQLAKAVYAVTSEGRFARDFGLRDQIQRAAVSVMSNIAEGFERGGDVEFRRFLAIAKGSAGEVKAQLYVALDAGLIDQTAFDSLYKSATETGNLIGGFMRYLSRGQKSRESRVSGHESASQNRTQGLGTRDSKPATS
ncbi:four helix bundle protein [Desulfobotulus alkaliphilus]|uniref:Four helix bundle protein n=1 Tax=Desulfobotulus alkaliphilus TaxID=622671 RepID=A0A562RYN5_9BACT|nr:four helix bundle protein [Desulfobotulus alkaliphilus]TWI73963.1 four helix bundle protein [Desulfobotulus alkaliphilus]